MSKKSNTKRTTTRQEKSSKTGTEPVDCLQVRCLELIDDEGRVRARLSLDTRYSDSAVPRLVMMNPRGQRLVDLGESEGGGHLQVSGDMEMCSASLCAPSITRMPNVGPAALRITHGEDDLVLTAEENNQLSFYDRADGITHQLSLQDHGREAEGHATPLNRHLISLARAVPSRQTQAAISILTALIEKA